MKTFITNPAHRHFRWFLLVLIFGASFLNYVDRQTVSILKTTLEEVFSMNDLQYARMVNAFTACYAIAYIGSGWMVDRIGPRLALFIFAGTWSLVTVGCGLAQSMVQLIILRAFLGLAEPGLQPVSIRVASAWAPPNQRGFFMSLCGVGSSIGNVVAPAIIVWLTLTWTWRWAFIIPGAIGLVIATIWWIFYRDPKVLPTTGVSKEEEQKHVKVEALSWGKLWKTKALWGIVLARLVSDPAWYFILFWLPGYLQSPKLGLSLKQLGMLGWLPFLASSLGGITASIISDRMAMKDKRDRLEGRKRLLFMMSAGGLLYMLIPHVDSLWGCMLIFCLVAIVCSCWLSTLAPIIAEIFPIGNVASVWGIAGAFGATGAFAFNELLGRATTFISMDTLFIVMGCMHPLAAVILFFLGRRPKMVKVQE